ncbi:cdc42 effector protein 1b [Neosynchiropus ocellatus]
MSLGKLPGIKGRASGSQEKRRFRTDLCADMISPPLGDFRHTMHVGRGGDVFGDTSFLSNYGGTREPGSPDSAYSSKSMGFFTRTFRHIGKSSGPRPRGGSRDLSSPPPDISPIIKNAVSLPQLNMDSPGGCLQRAPLPASVSSTDGAFSSYGFQSGFITLPRLSRLDRQFPDSRWHRGSSPDGDVTPRTRSDSLASFTVDLGPSLMSEVLSLIDLHRSGRDKAAADAEGEEGEEEEGFMADTPVQTPEATSPDLTSRLSEGETGSGRTPSASPPPTVEPVMDGERFQRAADVLSRHYGGSIRRSSSRTASPAFCSGRKATFSLSEEEEEIKV